MHLHILALDGVYCRDIESSELAFHALAEPTLAELTDVACRIARRDWIEQVLRKAGRWLDDEQQGPSVTDDCHLIDLLTTKPASRLK